MKATTIFGGATLLVVAAGVSIGSFREGHQGCGAQANAAVPVVDLFQLPGAAFVQEPWTAQEHPYDLTFTLEQAGDNTYTLITTVKLYSGSYYASPNCPRDLKGKFHVELVDQERVVLAERMKETPLTMEGAYYHPMVHGQIEWVRVDTRYEQRLTVTTREDLEVAGLYRFTIEPRCTLEEIPFVIRQRGGRLTIERVGC